jgi:hypothetical protein
MFTTVKFGFDEDSWYFLDWQLFGPLFTNKEDFYSNLVTLLIAHKCSNVYVTHQGVLIEGEGSVQLTSF